MVTKLHSEIFTGQGSSVTCVVSEAQARVMIQNQHNHVIQTNTCRQFRRMLTPTRHRIQTNTCRQFRRMLTPTRHRKPYMVRHVIHYDIEPLPIETFPLIIYKL